MPKYDGCLLIVKDARASKKFYEEVLKVKAIVDLDSYVVFEGGFSVMTEAGWQEFSHLKRDNLHYRHHSCELYFEDDDLDGYLKYLKSFPEIEMFNELATMPWEQRTVRFYDPDGHVLEVGDSMKVVVKRMLKAGASLEEAVKRSEFPLEFVQMCQAELDAEGGA